MLTCWMTAISEHLINGFAFAEKAACEARARYEFGCKFRIATTLDDGFIVGTRGFLLIARTSPWPTVVNEAIVTSRPSC